MILVDTSVWSLALRRAKEPRQTHPAVVLLADMISDDADLRVPGIVLQEVLSGVRHAEQFERLQAGLRGFPVVLPTAATHIRAAQVFNGCRAAGVAATAIDCLIAATAEEKAASLLAVDRDYEHMSVAVTVELVPWT